MFILWEKQVLQQYPEVLCTSLVPLMRLPYPSHCVNLCYPSLSLASLAKNLSILFICSKNQLYLLVSWLSSFSFHIISFCPGFYHFCHSLIRVFSCICFKDIKVNYWITFLRLLFQVNTSSYKLSSQKNIWNIPKFLISFSFIFTKV